MNPSSYAFIVFYTLYNVVISTNPILYSDNPSAVPIQNFDFVYIPKDVVHNHLPAFEKRKLDLEARKIAVDHKIKAPAFNQTASQVQLVEWFKRRQINQNDPKGERRAVLNKKLCRSTAELDLLIPLRRDLIVDLKRLHGKIQKDCSDKNGRLTDRQNSECRTMKEHAAHLSSKMMKMNTKERILLQLILDTRKEFILL